MAKKHKLTILGVAIMVFCKFKKKRSMMTEWHPLDSYYIWCWELESIKNIVYTPDPTLSLICCLAAGLYVLPCFVISQSCCLESYKEYSYTNLEEWY